jgi:exosome complex RNA-binding protein Rrp4
VETTIDFALGMGHKRLRLWLCGEMHGRIVVGVIGEVWVDLDNLDQVDIARSGVASGDGACVDLET